MTSVTAMPAIRIVSVSRIRASSGRDTKSCCSRLSATVACTSTPVNWLVSGVATISRVPSAVAPTKTMALVKVAGGVRPWITSAAETWRNDRLPPR